VASTRAGGCCGFFVKLWENAVWLRRTAATAVIFLLNTSGGTVLAAPARLIMAGSLLLLSGRSVQVLEFEGNEIVSCINSRLSFLTLCLLQPALPRLWQKNTASLNKKLKMLLLFTRKQPQTEACIVQTFCAL